MKKIIYVLIAICCIGLLILPILDKGNTNTINIDDINTYVLDGKWKMIIKDGLGSDAHYVLFDLGYNGISGEITENNGGNITMSSTIKEWQYDPVNKVIICIMNHDPYIMLRKNQHKQDEVIELQITEVSDANKMSWIYINKDKDTSYPVVRLK